MITLEEAASIVRPALAPTTHQVHAVADAIGCPEWTSPEGCNRKGQCFCSAAARRVIELNMERAR